MQVQGWWGFGCQMENKRFWDSTIHLLNVQMKKESSSVLMEKVDRMCGLSSIIYVDVFDINGKLKN